MIRETYKGRQLKAVKGQSYGKTRIVVNGTECGEWLGTQAEQIERAKRTIDDVDSRPFEGRWNECWYAPGTYELNEHGHVVAPGGTCSCNYCAERRAQPCADITVDGVCVCDHCMKPYLTANEKLAQPVEVVAVEAPHRKADSEVDAPAPEGYAQGQAVVVQRPGRAPSTGTVAHIHTAPGYVAVLDDRHRGVSNYPTRFVSAA